MNVKAKPMVPKSREEWQRELPEIEATLREFGERMHTRPFDNFAGLRGVSAFALYYFLKQAQPDVVFEVGVWKGLSTWIIQQAVPSARVFCFDPMFSLLDYLDDKKIGPLYRSDSVTYVRSEFSCTDIPALMAGAKRPLAFFDDHQPKTYRLRQAREAGIHDMIFDDNFPQPNGTHRTLAHEMLDEAGRAKLGEVLDRYEVFPALWDIDWVLGGERIQEKGLLGSGEDTLPHALAGHASDVIRRTGLPLPNGHWSLFRDRKWHSYVTYVHARSDG